MPTEGYIDGIKGRFLIGWARDAEKPGDRIELDVELDGEPIGRCVADLGRRDLVKHGVGDGHHAFRVKLPEALQAGTQHTVVVRARDGTVLPLSRNYVADVGGDGEQQRVTLKVDLAALARDNGDSAVAQALARAGGAHAGSPDEAAAQAVAGRPTAWYALLGQDGWLFTYDSPKRLARGLGLLPASPERVADWVRMVKARHDRVAELGAGYLAVTVPAKAAVYPELLPVELEVSADGRPADQLAAALRGEPSLEILDLVPVLRHARSNGEAFLRQGRQLSWPGAFHAYRAVMKELAKRFPEIEPPAVAEPELGELVEINDPLRSRERRVLVGGDLVPVLIHDDDPERERELARDSFDAMYVPLPEPAAEQLGPRAALLERTKGTELPTAVVLHDGLGGRLVPFLAEHFARTFVDIADSPPYELIEREHPLVVIQILSEESSFFA